MPTPQAAGRATPGWLSWLEAPILPAALSRTGHRASVLLALCVAIAGASLALGIAALLVGSVNLGASVMVAAFLDLTVLADRPQALYGRSSVTTLLVGVGGSLLCLVAGFVCAMIAVLQAG